MESTSSYFQDIIIPSFAWLVFLIILGAYVALGFRTWRAFRRNEFKLRLDDTLGLPKGTIRSFIVITFTAIMFLVFFGDFAGVTIPPEDRKWFLTAYGSVLAFYFGTKYFPERFASRGLAISSVSPPVSNPPETGTEKESLVISGSGFESPKSVTITGDGRDLPTSRMRVDSREKIDVIVTLAADTPPGPYDVTVELANGSRIVKTSGYVIDKAQPTSENGSP